MSEWDIPNYVTLIVEIIVGISIAFFVSWKVNRIWNKNREKTLVKLFSMINASFAMIEHEMNWQNLSFKNGIPNKIKIPENKKETILQTATICKDLLNDVNETIKFEGKELDYETLDEFKQVVKSVSYFSNKLTKLDLNQSDIAGLYVAFNNARDSFLTLKKKYPKEWRQVVEAHISNKILS